MRKQEWFGQLVFIFYTFLSFIWIVLPDKFHKFQPLMEGSRVDECPDYMHTSSGFLQPRESTARAKRWGVTVKITYTPIEKLDSL